MGWLLSVSVPHLPNEGKGRTGRCTCEASIVAGAPQLTLMAPFIPPQLVVPGPGHLSALLLAPDLSEADKCPP
jgi:hypothetical protein